MRLLCCRYRNATLPLLFDVQTTPPVGPGVNTVLSYGFADYEVEQHVYMRHRNDGSMVRPLQTNTLRYGFSVLLQATSSVHPPQRLYQRASNTLWQTAGRQELQRGRPQVMPFAEYARFCFPRSLNVTPAPGVCPAALATPAFVEFALPDGSRAGGLRTVWGTWANGNSAVFNKIHNYMWWNNVHMATGFGGWGAILGEADPLGSMLKRAAELVLNTALSSPTVAQGGIVGLDLRVESNRWTL